MVKEIIVPHLGESVSDGTIGRWVKKVGDVVAADEPLVELETDKVTLDINAPVSGVLKEMRVVSGDVVRVGQIIGVLEEAGIQTDKPAAPTPPPPEELSAAKRFTMTVQKITGMDKPKSESPKSEPLPPSQLESDRLSPAVRRMLSERGFGPDQTPNKGSGRDGRLLKADVMAINATEPMVLTTFAPPAEQDPAQNSPAVVSVPDTEKTPPTLEEKREEKSDPIAQTNAPMNPTERPADPAPAKPENPVLSDDILTETALMVGSTDHLTLPENRVKMTRLRSRIAQRLKEAQNTAALLTTFNDIDMSHVMATRDSYKEAFYERFDIKLGFMSFFVKATVAALKEMPILNAAVEGDEIIYKYHYDIGVAVGADQGLVVPVVRDADQLSFADIEVAIADLSQKAKDGKLTVDDLTGGTFTITNGGIFGSLMSTPIINPPQSAILGMHKIAQRAVVIDGRIEARPMMYVALTYDHRIIDGRDAVRFLVRIKEYMEDPKRLLLGI